MVKGKKKISCMILNILIITMVLFNFTGCGNEDENSSSDSNKNQNSKNYSEYEQNVDDDSEDEDTYDFSFLRKEYVLEKDLKEIDGKIIDIKRDVDDYYCTNNNVYKCSSGKPEGILKSTKTIKCMSWVGNNVVILQNSDDSYSIYCEEYQFDGASRYVFKELEGIEAENTIYASYSGVNMILIKNYNNSYYADWYKLDNNKKIETKKLKLPLHLHMSSNTEVKEVSNIKQIYVDGGYLIFTLSDGQVYKSGVNVLYSGWDDENVKITSQYFLELSDVNKIYTNGSSLEYGRPLFEKLGDKNNLYTYNSEAPLVEGTPDEQYKISIPLPNGYTTDDIKNVLLYEDLLIEFNDKNIYIAKEDDLSKLLYNEDLSSLNKKGKIMKMCSKTYHFIVLMDDNCTYEDIKNYY